MHDPNLGRFLQRDPLGILPTFGNLYAYAADGPLNVGDPMGLEEQPAAKPKPEVTFGNQFSETAAFLKWKGVEIDVPKDLNIYTLVDMEWEINDCDKCAVPRKGSYRFWFEGFVQSGADFNLGAYHGSHNSVNAPGTKGFNKNLPSFKNEKEWEAYMTRSFNTKGTFGSLAVRFEYEGYRERKAEEKFNPPDKREGGAPMEAPTPNPNKGGGPWSPNRQRRFLRRSKPWLAEKPKIWGEKPNWWREVGFVFSWDWCEKEFKTTLVKVFSY